MGKVINVDEGNQREKKEEKIRDSKFNRWYGKIKGEGIPKYLKKQLGESR